MGAHCAGAMQLDGLINLAIQALSCNLTNVIF
jgi:hypothetical protein